MVGSLVSYHLLLYGHTHRGLGIAGLHSHVMRSVVGVFYIRKQTEPQEILAQFSWYHDCTVPILIW